MTDYTEYFEEVIKAHVAIEQWLAEERDGRELEQLLTRFSPQFSMVSPLGRVLDFAALNELFLMAGGKKLGFRIELSELRGIARHCATRGWCDRELSRAADRCDGAAFGSPLDRGVRETGGRQGAVAAFARDV